MVPRQLRVFFLPKNCPIRLKFGPVMCFCMEGRILEKNHFPTFRWRHRQKNRQKWTINHDPSQQRLKTRKILFQAETLQAPSLNVVSCSEWIRFLRESLDFIFLVTLIGNLGKNVIFSPSSQTETLCKSKEKTSFKNLIHSAVHAYTTKETLWKIWRFKTFAKVHNPC